MASERSPRSPMTRLAGRLLHLAAAGVLLLPAALAQPSEYDAEPFFDEALRQSRAYGLEMTRVRLALVAAIDAPLHEDLVEQVEKMTERDAPRYLGSLRAADPELAVELEAALELVAEQAEDGEYDPATVSRARQLLDRAEAALFDDATRASPDYIAALMADLILADDGVAEAYEDAVEEELWEYSNGWAALGRTQEYWAELRLFATAQQKADVEEMLEQLAALYPSPTPPAEMSANPEEAEAPAQRLVGLLEEVSGASLYSGRDLPRLAGHLAELTSEACELYAAGETEVAGEYAAAVRDPYRKSLRRLLDLLAPEVHAEISVRLDALTGREDEPFPADPAATCREIVEGLQQGQAILGG